MKALEVEEIKIEFMTRYPEFSGYILFAGVGDRIRFGNYFLQNETTKEPIEWRVLARGKNRILVISEYALDCQQYNTSNTNVTWETCTLRKWMNGTFLNNAFSAEEQAQIQSTNVSADKNPKYSTNPGNATTDKVFLLSITEAAKYFTSDSARQCKPTEYAVANRAFVNDISGNCFFWLRSPGSNQNQAAKIYPDGSICCYGTTVHNKRFGVRPALWIDLSK